MRYIELHLHTHFSLLDGLNTPDEYLARASELGMSHMAITDHGNLSGHREFQAAAKKHGVTPILGCEMYISPTDRFDRRAIKKRFDNTQAYNHLTVLAQNEIGLKNLNKLSEIAWTEGFYSKPRIDMDVLEEYNEGLIVTSGCLNGLIAKAIANKLDVQANQLAREFKRILGDRFFIELQGHNPREINDGLIEVAQNHKILSVVTSDCHYAREEDLWLEEAMLILATNPKHNKEFDFSKSQKMEMLERFNYAYPDRQMSFEHFGLFLHSYQEQINHQELPLDSTWDQDYWNQAVDNTMIVASMIGDYPFYENLDLLPKPKNVDPDELLTDMAWDGLRERGFGDDPEYRARLIEELEIIISKNFSSYFLIEADIVKWGREQGILFGPGRGSGAGSLVNYALRITNVDPVKHNLLFFRFINPERNDFPDIDTDVEDRRRSEIKGYATRTYKHVASIATFGTFQGKNSVRDAARVFLVPLGDVNRALKGADWPSDWFEHWEKTEKGRDFVKKYPEVIKLAKFMYGRLRTQGMHAGGLVFSKEPINRYAPIQSAKDNSDEAGTRIPIVAYDMETVADIRLIKYDFLGLKALTIISDTLQTVKERTSEIIDLDMLPLDDNSVYSTLSSGWTKGVFQVEAVPYTNLIIKMGGVKNFDELVASNALVRPGAMNSTAGADFINRKQGKAHVSYPHQDMEWFTDETYGAIIYQEQVMLTMTELAGMKMSTADKVRKIIGKKRDVKGFEAYKTEFINGASKKVSKKVAERLWHDFEAHAGYSFNKSHAVAYSMISYWTAWLKEQYPIEFMTAVLRNEQDKDSLLDYLIEVKRMGIRVMLPHVNMSDVNFEIQSDDRGEYIRFGLSNIKFISGKLATRLMDTRPFNTYEDLHTVVTTKNSGMNVRMLHSLNAIGGAAFDDNPRTGKERENFYEYLNIPAFETKKLSPKMTAQFRTLDEFTEGEAFVIAGMVRKIKTGEGWSLIEVVDETGSAGMFHHEHTPIEAGQMYVMLVSNNRIARYISVNDLIEGSGFDFKEFLETTEFPDVPEGMLRVVSFVGRTTRAGKKMADVVFSDSEKNLQSALVFPSMFFKAISSLNEGDVVDVKLDKTDDGAVFVQNIL